MQARVLLGVLAVALCAEADTIAEYTAGTSGGGAFVGYRFTTPAGSPYNLEKFTWLWTNGSSHAGAGKLWLLNQAYAGTPDALSTGTTGYLAQSDTYGTSEAGYYTFASTPLLSPSTNYWVYMSDAAVGSVGMDSPTADVRYFSIAGGNAYFTVANESVNFRAEGSPAVPEPGTLTLFGVATIAGGLMARRRRKRKA